VSQGVYRTNNTLSVQYKYCCFDVCSTAISAYIVQGQIATFDGRILSSNLGEMSQCHAEFGECTLADGSVVVWEKRVLGMPCPFRTNGKAFDITRLGLYYLVEKTQQAFSVTKGRKPPPQHCLPGNHDGPRLHHTGNIDKSIITRFFHLPTF